MGAVIMEKGKKIRRVSDRREGGKTLTQIPNSM
jgi:hypothetical protein